MLNKVIIMGRLTRDPELKTTASGTSVCSFSVAVDRRYQKAGEERQTDFINVVAWRQSAEFVSRYFQKGRMINVVGSLQTRTYDDAQGNKRYVTEVVADEINFCGDSRRDSEGGNNSGFGTQGGNSGFGGAGLENDGFAPFETSDDLPF